MIVYIIKSILCSGLFIGVYYVFLEKEKANTFKRFYLLLSLTLSAIVPAITMAQLSKLKPTSIVFSQATENWSANTLNVAAPEEPNTFYVILIAGYLLITAVMLFRLIKNIRTIIQTTSHASIVDKGFSKLIISPEHTTPHTFLNYIFLNEQDAKNPHILTHELTHSTQRHSLDIIFVELFHCLYWFNPIIILFKKAIQLNHEFLADDSVIEHHSSTASYQKLLIDKITGHQTALTSSFNYSLTKKRFTMMNTSQNQKRSVIRIACSLSILLASMFVFTNSAAQAPVGDEYTVYKDGKWQNVKPTNTPGPEDAAALYKQLQRIIRYPESAKKDGVEGDVAVMFEVDIDGQLKNFSVVKKLQANCDNEVINAVRNSGITWLPAKLDGKAYATRFVLPMKFRFDPSDVKDSFNGATVQAKVLNEVVVVAYRPQAGK